MILLLFVNKHPLVFSSVVSSLVLHRVVVVVVVDVIAVVIAVSAGIVAIPLVVSRHLNVRLVLAWESVASRVVVLPLIIVLSLS